MYLSPALEIKSIHPILDELNFYDLVTYSIESSGSAFKAFVETLDYTDSTKSSFNFIIMKTHKMFPKVKFLQTYVGEKGIIKVGQEISKSSARGTAYLYFLSMIGILDMQYKDYFYTNPKTILKLDRWLEQYKKMLGIQDFVHELINVAESTSNRNINIQRQRKLGDKVGIYLILRYKLFHLRELEFHQWQEFMLECRNCNRHIQTASVSLMHLALVQMGIIEEEYSKKVSGAMVVEKKRDWIDQSIISPYYRAFEEFISVTRAKGTARHYKDSIENFCNYIKSVKAEDFTMDKLTRSDITKYITHLYTIRDTNSDSYSFKWLESNIYSIKVFLRFISEHSSEFKKQGIPIFPKKIIADQDFKVERIKYLPKPMEEEALNALLDTLSFVENKRYRLTFLLMLSTGLAQADVLNLKLDCLKQDDEERFSLNYYRVKTKKHVKIQALPDTITIIKEIQKMNTQKVTLPHVDSSHCIYLLNDGGKNLKSSWLRHWMKKHKNITLERFSSLEDQIKGLTSHRLRHTFASRMRDKGVGIVQLKELLGHNSISVTQKYVKESDRLKIELIKQLESGQYVCDSIEKMGSSGLHGEQGISLIESLLRHENRFIGGRCTVQGYENCKNAYRCLTCPYLCTTKEDLPELISLIRIQHLQYQELISQLDTACGEIVTYLEIDKNRLKDSLKALFNKYNKLVKFTAQKQQEMVNLRVGNEHSKDLISFL